MLKIIFVLFVIILIYVMYTERDKITINNFFILNAVLLGFSLYLLVNGPLKDQKPNHVKHSFIYFILAVVIVLYVYYEAFE